MAKAETTQFFILRDGSTVGPFSRDELLMSVLDGEISQGTLYSYDRARKWRPLTHLIGEINPQVIEDRRKRYYLLTEDKVVGPYSYFELKDMVCTKAVSLQTLAAIENGSEWRPVGAIPIPRIPAAPSLDAPLPGGGDESAANDKSFDLGGGLTFSMKIRCEYLRDGYYLLAERSAKANFPGRLYVGGPVSLEYLKEMLASGEVRRNTPCARMGAIQWMTAGDYA